MELYVARDEDGRLFLYLNEPERDYTYGVFQRSAGNSWTTEDFMEMPQTAFSSVTWENSPVKVTLNLLEWPEQKE